MGSSSDIMGAIKGAVDISMQIVSTSAKIASSFMKEAPTDIPEDILTETFESTDAATGGIHSESLEIKEDVVRETPELQGEAEGQFDFNGVDCYTDTERMDATLDNFQDDNWADMELEDKKQSMNELADYVIEVTGNENPPDIVFRDDMGDGEYGGYDPSTNTLEINENLLDDNAEAADTVAHELWHAYQQQCAEELTSERGREYQEGFESYISPEYDYEGYQNQMVEAEARAFAQNFKDRLDNLKGGNQ